MSSTPGRLEIIESKMKCEASDIPSNSFYQAAWSVFGISSITFQENGVLLNINVIHSGYKVVTEKCLSDRFKERNHPWSPFLWLNFTLCELLKDTVTTLECLFLCYVVF